MAEQENAHFTIVENRDDVDIASPMAHGKVMSVAASCASEILAGDDFISSLAPADIGRMHHGHCMTKISHLLEPWS